MAEGGSAQANGIAPKLAGGGGHSPKRVAGAPPARRASYEDPEFKELGDVAKC